MRAVEPVEQTVNSSAGGLASVSDPFERNFGSAVALRQILRLAVKKIQPKNSLTTEVARLLVLDWIKHVEGVSNSTG